MKRFLISLSLLLSVENAASSQTKSPPSAARSANGAKRPAAGQATLPLPGGTISGNVYTNPYLGLTVQLPESWTVVTDEFARYMKGKGVDLAARPPRAADLLSQKKVDVNFKRLTILVTAYRSLPGSPQNSMIRIAAENIRQLDTNRPVNDAVDYVDLMRAQLASVKMPVGYKYSETQAEQLGRNQFAYLDTDDSQGKTRIYVTVRNGYAVLLSINYVADEDLETFRDVLARATFFG